MLLLGYTAAALSLFSTLSSAVPVKRKFVNTPEVGVVIELPVDQNTLDTFQPTLLNAVGSILPQVEIGVIPQSIKVPVLPRLDLNLTQIHLGKPLIDLNASSVTLKDGYLAVVMKISQLSGTLALKSNFKILNSNVSIVAHNVVLNANVGLKHDAAQESLVPDFQQISLNFGRELSLHLSGSPTAGLVNAISQVLPGVLGTVVSARLQQQTRDYAPMLLQNFLKLSVLVPSLIKGAPIDTFHLAFPAPPRVSEGKMVLTIAIRGGVNQAISNIIVGPSSHPLNTTDAEPANNGDDLVNDIDKKWFGGEGI